MQDAVEAVGGGVEAGLHAKVGQVVLVRQQLVWQRGVHPDPVPADSSKDRARGAWAMHRKRSAGWTSKEDLDPFKPD